MASKLSELAFINGIPELLILKLLQHREMYGYEIVRAIADATASVIDAGEGSVYPLLHALEKKKFLSSRKKAVEGRTRIYYTLTESGAAQLRASAARWKQVAAAVNHVLGGSHEPHAAV